MKENKSVRILLQISTSEFSSPAVYTSATATNRKQIRNACLVVGVVTLLSSIALFPLPQLLISSATAVQTPHLIAFYLSHWRLPNQNDWFWFFLELGIGYDIALWLSIAFAAAGWITWAEAASLLTLSGVGIAVLAAIMAF